MGHAEFMREKRDGRIMQGPLKLLLRSGVKILHLHSTVQRKSQNKA